MYGTCTYLNDEPGRVPVVAQRVEVVNKVIMPDLTRPSPLLQVIPGSAGTAGVQTWLNGPHATTAAVGPINQVIFAFPSSSYQVGGASWKLHALNLMRQSNMSANRPSYSCLTLDIRIKPEWGRFILKPLGKGQG